MLDCSQSSKGRSHAMFPASTPEGKGGIARAAAMETKVERTHTGHFFRFNIGGFHVTSSPPCWWTVNKRSLISSLCLSTSICSFHHCCLCLPRLRENHLLDCEYIFSYFSFQSGENYRKILKISPGAYILQRPFLRGLFLEGLIFGGAYKRREICVFQNRLG